MQKLGTAITESIVHHYGPSEFLTRISDPFWTAWVNQRLSPQVRATVISMSSHANALGQIAGGPAVGAIGTFWSLRAALLSSALLLTPVLGLIPYTARRHERDLVPVLEVSEV